MFWLYQAVVEPTPPTVDYLTPVILTAGTVLVAALGLLGTVYRRRQDRADKMTDVAASKELSEREEFDVLKQARDEATRYYNFYVAFRDLYYAARDALKHLVRVIQHRDPDMELPPDVTTILQASPPDTPPR